MTIENNPKDLTHNNLTCTSHKTKEQQYDKSTLNTEILCNKLQVESTLLKELESRLKTIHWNTKCLKK